MSYRQIAAKFLNALFTAGLCIEIFLVKLVTDAAQWVHEGGKDLQASGERQIEAIPR